MGKERSKPEILRYTFIFAAVTGVATPLLSACANALENLAEPDQKIITPGVPTSEIIDEELVIVKPTVVSTVELSVEPTQVPTPEPKPVPVPEPISELEEPTAEPEKPTVVATPTAVAREAETLFRAFGGTEGILFEARLDEEQQLGMKYSPEGEPHYLKLGVYPGIPGIENRPDFFNEVIYYEDGEKKFVFLTVWASLGEHPNALPFLDITTTDEFLYGSLVFIDVNGEIVARLDPYIELEEGEVEVIYNQEEKVYLFLDEAGEVVRSWEIFPSAQATILVEALNVRSGPGTEYAPPIGTLEKGETVEVVGRTESGWYQVVIFNQEGEEQIAWIFGSDEYVDANNLAQEALLVPEDEIPPRPTLEPKTEPTLAPATEEMVTLSRVNVYRSPNESDYMSYVLPGKTFVILERRDGWLHINVWEERLQTSWDGWIQEDSAFGLVEQEFAMEMFPETISPPEGVGRPFGNWRVPNSLETDKRVAWGQLVSGEKEAGKIVVSVNISDGPDPLIIKGSIYEWAVLRKYDYQLNEEVVSFLNLGQIGKRGDIVTLTVNFEDLEKWQADHNFEIPLIRFHIRRF